MILAEVRETSRKPDELYAIIERLFDPILSDNWAAEGKTDPGEKEEIRMVELFGRQHNTRPGWSVVHSLPTSRKRNIDLLDNIG